MIIEDIDILMYIMNLFFNVFENRKLSLLISYIEFDMCDKILMKFCFLLLLFVNFDVNKEVNGIILLISVLKFLVLC